ncbi:MAG TPA: carbohydrate ABC transporter permease [Herpetosiphonaceae bacterium]|nr:carbohydrate ABC transporter permease [Herpetosiphonaceae bacterium]
MAATTPDRVSAPRQSGLSYRNRLLLKRTAIYAVLILWALIFLLPLFWMLSTSLKPKSQWFSRDIAWIPRTITMENYERILNNSQTPIGRWFVNSLIVGTITTALVLLIDAMAAYAYARMEFRGRKVIFALLLATLFLPGMMFLVPNFITVARLGLLNSFAGVIIPGLAGVFGVFFLRQFFTTIPKELEEAAQIDGASQLMTFFRVVLPLAKSAMVTLGILTFLGSWNEFLWALLILKDRNIQTLPPGLRTLQGAYTSEYGQMMAGAVIAAVPVLLLYLVMQKYIVQSVATSGLAGQ